MIDTIKWNDLKCDTHSSKHIVIPLTVGRQISILNKEKIDERTAEIDVLIKAENAFNPHEDMEIGSLRFGAPEEVNFGQGAKVLKSAKQGDDLLITFEGKGNGLTDDNFAAKLLGRTNKGKLLFGYSRLPWVDYIQPTLSARLPKINKSGDGFDLEVEVRNFGQVVSQPSKIKVEYVVHGENIEVASGLVPKLNSFEKTTVKLTCGNLFVTGIDYNFVVSIFSEQQKPVILHGEVTL